MSNRQKNTPASPGQAVEAENRHSTGQSEIREQEEGQASNSLTEQPSPVSNHDVAASVACNNCVATGNPKVVNAVDVRRRTRKCGPTFPTFRNYEHLYLPGGPLAPTDECLSFYNQPQFVPGPTCSPAFAVHYNNRHLDNSHVDRNIFVQTEIENNGRHRDHNNRAYSSYFKTEPDDRVTLYDQQPYSASGPSRRVITVAPNQVTCDGTAPSPTQNPNISEPKAHHHNDAQPHQDIRTRITNRAAKPPPRGKNPVNTNSMPSAITAMPEQQFSYPPLGEMLDTHPYALPEQRAFHQLANERDYAHEEHEHEHLADGPPRYATPPPNAEYQLHASIANELQAALDSKTEATDEGVRSKAVPKPDRPVTKDSTGRYVCNWPGCDEVIKDFGRKCEWSKHMDKHDRPYKCPVPGCAKLPGFTYSGGLLRHEREVHHKHGGPRKQLNCPHMNCKRHHGKGFSRQENLNEHMRRVHTGTGVGGEAIGAEESEVEGVKRKREDDEDMREELKRIKNENEELKRQTEEMMRQIRALQEQAGAMAQQHMEAHAQQQAQQATRIPAASMI